MNTGIYFRMVVGALRNPPKLRHLGQQYLQRTALAQHLKHAGRSGLHQAARQLLPDALSHQGVNLAVCHHLLHEPHGFGRHIEVRKARRKACHTQDAYGVLAKGRSDMAQYPGPEVCLTTVRVDQNLKISIKRSFSPMISATNSYRINSKVAPRQVLLQRHV